MSGDFKVGDICIHNDGEIIEILKITRTRIKFYLIKDDKEGFYYGLKKDIPLNKKERIFEDNKFYLDGFKKIKGYNSKLYKAING